MSKQTIAIVTGGYSSEAIVALKSAQTLFDNISSEKYNKYIVVISKDKWYCQHNSEELNINKDDFSFQLNGSKVNFDCAYITIHGTPGEDGKLQGYFDMIGIPYTTASQQASTVTFNKWMTNQILGKNGFNCANSLLLLKQNQYTKEEIISKLGLPCFVKPNDGGSSFGISRVNKQEDLLPAIEKAFKEGKQVVIESFIEGTEVTCGAFEYKESITPLPLTEIVSHNEYFDYDAKYNGLSDEITPARISDDLTKLVQETTIKIYKLFKLSGIIRVDFILKNNIPFIIEVNTTPGMSRESIVPQQVKHSTNISLPQLLDMMIEEAIKRHKI